MSNKEKILTTSEPQAKEIIPLEAELYSKFLDEFEEEFKKVKTLTPNNIFNWLANKTWRKSRLSV